MQYCHFVIATYYDVGANEQADSLHQFEYADGHPHNYWVVQHIEHHS